ncbi:MAG: hypothetical protein N2V75_07750 [Methanophagales archaeon]|nr:hypothetical protein [Methanophagales archaeon]
MKKIGIVLAALVIATFMVGTAAAMNQINQPEQEQYFTEKSAAQGTGFFDITKKIVDKDIAVVVEESISGFTGLNGTFAIQSKEILNESVNISDPKDPDYRHTKSIDFQAGEGGSMTGFEMYASPAFHGGTGAKVKEIFDVIAMQKQETTTIKTTSAICQRQSLNFDTQTQFTGTWGTQAEWKKICKKEILHEQVFTGDFQVTKNLIFEEHVTKPCLKDDC